MIGVIDASVTLSWILREENMLAVDRLFAHVADEGAVVPGIWRLEVANALQVGIKRVRIDLAYRDAAIQKLALLPVEVDSETNEHAWTRTLHLSGVHGLTVYDAAYLELALRRGTSLATGDAKLAAAAQNAGVKLLLIR